MCVAESCGEQPGRQQDDDAVEVGDAGAHRDQREHVEVARDDGLRAAHEERPAAPQHDRRGESKLHIVRPRAGEMQGAEMRTHVECYDRKRERRRDPQAPRHRNTFAVVCLAASFGFKRHPADRTMARPVLADLRMHRAGVDRAF